MCRLGLSVLVLHCLESILAAQFLRNILCRSMVARVAQLIDEHVTHWHEVHLTTLRCLLSCGHYPLMDRLSEFVKQLMTKTMNVPK